MTKREPDGDTKSSEGKFTKKVLMKPREVKNPVGKFMSVYSQSNS